MELTHNILGICDIAHILSIDLFFFQIDLVSDAFDWQRSACIAFDHDARSHIRKALVR